MYEELFSCVEKPGRYLGNEWNSVRKDLNKASVKFALVFPDLYEIGMSHIGFKLLYHLLNSKEYIACERAFSPGTDMERLLRKESLPIFSLESKEPLSNFDIIGFSLAYELNYTNVLNILDLANIPLLAKDRNERYPLVIAGGPSVFNPEPISDFIDFFLIGEAEELIIEIVELIKRAKAKGNYSKDKLLEEVTRIEGVYVPAFYKVEYHKNGSIKSFLPIAENIPSVVKKRRIENLNSSFYPTAQIVPYIDIVHDRVSIEIMRGCPHLCRFCQARAIYHHKRERSLSDVVKLAEESITQTGYEELSLLSLSSGDHSEILPMITNLIDRFKDRGIAVSLPSLRIEEISKEVPAILSKIRKSGLTFAPEAGSVRLRRFINKDIDMDQLRHTVRAARKAGWRRVKLYYMIGLPTETVKDIDDIISSIKILLAENRRLYINVSISSFIPKPHTPFQWERMERKDILLDKMKYILKHIRSNRVKIKFQDVNLSFLEGIFSQGDRRLGRVILKAFKKGCKMDSWIEHLNFKRWMDTFNEENINPAFYIHRKKSPEEHLPWDHIDCGMSKGYLIKEMKSLFY